MDLRNTALHVLAFFPSPKDAYRDPMFSPREIFCGPDAQRRIEDGRVLSLRTPVGDHDAGAIRSLLPSSQEPDLVVVKADALRRNMPRNLKAFACPKVLLVGDTHLQNAPLRTVISYAQSEPFDFIVFDHTRHHAQWFARAGLRNLHWLPALEFRYVSRNLRLSRAHPLTSIGPSGSGHPWERAVLSQVRKAGLPLEELQGTLCQTADWFADSEVTLHVSQNGDLGLRVFEALSAGGFLLTENLPDASGLRALFEPGKHLDVWNSPGELIEKIRYYLANPAEVTRIRGEGRAEILRSHHPATKIRELLELVFEHRSNPRYDLALDATVVRSLAPARVEPERVRCLTAYEWIQEIHRTSASATLYCSEDVQRSLYGVVELPRLELRSHGSLTPTPPRITADAEPAHNDVLWIDSTRGDFLGLMSRFTGALVIAPNTAAPRLAEWGFHASARSDDGMGLFRQSQPSDYMTRAWDTGAHETVSLLLPHFLAKATTAEECLVVADRAARLKQRALHLSALSRAVALDRSCQRALVQLSAVAMEQKEHTFAAMALEEARRCGPLPVATDRIRLQLGAGLADKLRPYHTLVGRAEPVRAEKLLRILIVTHLFPPQEAGDYGQMIWDYARGLRARGHAVGVLAGDSDTLGRDPSAEEAEMEHRVSRSLELTGRSGADMNLGEGERSRAAAIEASNAARVLREASVFEPDLILVGNLDQLGVTLVNEVVLAGFPVLHMVASREPGYAAKDQPRASSYWVSPCSEWTGRVLREAGYEPGRMTLVYPGARIDRFYRAFLPDSRTLRIAYAGLIAPHKGIHVLVEALSCLQAQGIRFSAEIAGEAPDKAYLEKLRDYCARHAIAGKVAFTGCPDRDALGALLSRSNVFAAPSQFAEPFDTVQVEAMAAGLVVVTSGTGGSGEIIRDGQDGLMFKADNPAELAEKLSRLSADPALFKRLQFAAQRSALSLSVAASVRQIEGLADELIHATAIQFGGGSSAVEGEPLSLGMQASPRAASSLSRTAA